MKIKILTFALAVSILFVVFVGQGKPVRCPELCAPTPYCPELCAPTPTMPPLHFGARPSK